MMANITERYLQRKGLICTDLSLILSTFDEKKAKLQFFDIDLLGDMSSYAHCCQSQLKQKTQSVEP